MIILCSAVTFAYAQTKEVMFEGVLRMYVIDNEGNQQAVSQYRKTDWNNTYLAFLLGLTYVDEGSADCEYRGRFEEPVSFDEAVSLVEKALDLPANYVRCVDGGKEKIRTVGLCTGAGGSYIPGAVKNGCDLFVTGDLKFHEAQYAKAAGISVIDAGHYGTEKIFVENMAHQIYAKAAQKSLDIDVIMAEANTNPYTL